MNRKEIKARAKEFAFSNKWAIWKPLLIIYAISFVFGMLIGILGIEEESLSYQLITIAFQIAVLPISVGYIYYLIKLTDGETPNVKEALLSKFSIFGLILVTAILVFIFTWLWALLLIIPGIIYAFKMVMVNYILADDGAENMSHREVMAKSKQMMDGHKIEYFVFCLSFIGWILLGFVTFFIAYIWVIPYMTTAQVMYYKELKKLTEQTNTNTLNQPETTQI